MCCKRWLSCWSGKERARRPGRTRLVPSLSVSEPSTSHAAVRRGDGIVPRMITPYRAWGKIPPGFKRIEDDCGSRLILRGDQEGVLSVSSWDHSTDSDGPTRFQGRERLRAVRLRNGGTVLLRR